MWVHGVPFILTFKRSTFWHVPFTGDAQTSIMEMDWGRWPQSAEIESSAWKCDYRLVSSLFVLFWWFWCVNCWDFDEAMNLLYHQDLIETCHLFTYFVAQQNQVQTCLLLQVTVESTICLAWRLSHLVFVDHLLTTHCCLTTSYIHLPSILFLRACTDMVVSSLLFLLQSLGELAMLM